MAAPHVVDRQFPAAVTRVEGNAADLGAAEVVVVLVDHAEFDRDLIAGAPVTVLDCRRALSGARVAHL